MLNTKRKINSKTINMIKHCLVSVLSLAVLLFASNGLNAQEGTSVKNINGGIIRYEHVKYYNWDSYQTGNNPRMKQMLADQPASGMKGKVLYFTKDESLFATDPQWPGEPPSRLTQGLLLRMSVQKPPVPSIIESYINFEKESRTDLVELMTRRFRVEQKLENPGWKPGTEQKKILGYVCMNASLQKDEKTIVAWYTTELPYSIGPENYRGLPGAILAVEIDGRNTFLATSVELETPAEELIQKPSEGKKMSRKEFDKLLAQKVKEFKEDQGKEGTSRRDSNN
ncbi:MAG TPA: GLPGLI family protein [Bacteroidetes bacterium]|nr:GLPGLI family protein [Bacteroidota bacterium]